MNDTSGVDQDLSVRKVRFCVAKNMFKPVITDILLLIFIYEVCVGISAKGSHKMDQSDAATACKNVILGDPETRREK